MHKRWLALPMIAVLCATSSPAWAQAGSVKLVLSGDAYDGPPEFSVLFDGKEIGMGAVTTAIDTEAEGPLSVDDVGSRAQFFEFPIADGAFDPSGELSIRLTNDKWSEGTSFDRNLAIISVTVNGYEIPPAEVRVFRAGGEIQMQRLGEYAVVYSNTQEAIAYAPEGGWPPPSGTPPPVAEAVAQEEAAPAEPTVAAPGCNSEFAVDIVDFPKGEIGLTRAQRSLLDGMVDRLAGQTCSVTVSGYASTGGPTDVNLLLSEVRAQRVLDYLVGAGVQFAGQELVPVGETQQFGETEEANRRVIVEVKAP
jgi:outer membrane protein OmpA-like peptidoglycan-associated protein